MFPIDDFSGCIDFNFNFAGGAGIERNAYGLGFELRDRSGKFWRIGKTGSRFAVRDYLLGRFVSNTALNRARKIVDVIAKKK